MKTFPCICLQNEFPSPLRQTISAPHPWRCSLCRCSKRGVGKASSFLGKKKDTVKDGLGWCHRETTASWQACSSQHLQHQMMNLKFQRSRKRQNHQSHRHSSQQHHRYRSLNCPHSLNYSCSFLSSYCCKQRKDKGEES